MQGVIFEPMFSPFPSTAELQILSSPKHVTIRIPIGAISTSIPRAAHPIDTFRQARYAEKNGKVRSISPVRVFESGNMAAKWPECLSMMGLNFYLSMS